MIKLKIKKNDSLKVIRRIEVAIHRVVVVMG
jgi:hypothetical protein